MRENPGQFIPFPSQIEGTFFRTITPMTYPFSDDTTSSSQLISSDLRQWATEHYRIRTFFREEKIPTRSGILYFVDEGFVRLESLVQPGFSDDETTLEFVNTVIAFVGANQAIDIFASEQLTFEAIAQTDRTTIFWLYWTDLEMWADLRLKVLQHLRYQHQRQLLLRSILGQKRTIDQLYLYLKFLAHQYGQKEGEGLKIPFGLTHENLASVLGTTRVTISRLLSQLREERKVMIVGEQYFGIPFS